jgi:hypothetical protein
MPFLSTQTSSDMKSVCDIAYYFREKALPPHNYGNISKIPQYSSPFQFIDWASGECYFGNRITTKEVPPMGTDNIDELVCRATDSARENQQAKTRERVLFADGKSGSRRNYWTQEGRASWKNGPCKNHPAPKQQL